MKKIFFALTILFSLFVSSSNAQTGNKYYLPDRTTIIPYFLPAGFNTTTIIIFPLPIIDADKGFTDIIVEKQKGVENILKIKAATRDFPPTNVHAYTTDGKIYAFNVEYSERPYCATFDLNKLNDSTTLTSPVSFTNAALTGFELQRIASQLKDSASFFSRKSRKYGIRIELQTIHVVKDVLFFGFTLENRSNLDFDIDFSRLHITDKKKGKRTSFQQQDMTALYLDPIKQISANNNLRFMVAVSKFSIPDKKEFGIELFEKNGGRHISLRIKNRHLLKARTF